MSKFQIWVAQPFHSVYTHKFEYNFLIILLNKINKIIIKTIGNRLIQTQKVSNCFYKESYLLYNWLICYL